jgi:hypothetical protein
MTDQEDREQESQETEETRYERELEGDLAAREAAAERLRDEPLPEPDESA